MAPPEKDPGSGSPPNVRPVPLATALLSDQPHARAGRVLEVAEAPGPGHPHRLAYPLAAGGLDFRKLRLDICRVDVRQRGRYRRMRLEDSSHTRTRIEGHVVRHRRQRAPAEQVSEEAGRGGPGGGIHLDM